VAKPIVKWAGGKTRLLPELLAETPKRIRTYVEPFAGGAALFFKLASEPRCRFARAVLVDQNPELVTCYRAVQKNVDHVIDALNRFADDPARKELYYRLRDEPTADMPAPRRAARLIFLNRTGYNGLWRVNASGRFNVPYGRYENPRIVDVERLQAASRALERAEILHGDFSIATRPLGDADFVYFDPPYVPVSKTASFTAYASKGFGPSDQERLAAELRRLATRGVHAMLSNADTKETRRLYAGLSHRVVRVPRAINSDPSKRGEIPELLVRNW
jgi:DNA adenine methylase